MTRKQPEEYTKYWSMSARVYAERREEGLAERLAAMAASTHALAGALIVANIFNVLQLIPEFWDALSRFSEIALLPPDVIRARYPELYNGLILASSLSTTAHILFEVAYSSARRQFMPVFTGVWRFAFAAFFVFALITNALAAILIKTPAAILNTAILTVSMPFAFNSRYDRISEEVNKIRTTGGGV
ncbi:MAG: hypothetical protein ABWK01_07960 [Infirmifilum sp.]